MYKGFQVMMLMISCFLYAKERDKQKWEPRLIKYHDKKNIEVNPLALFTEMYSSPLKFWR